MKKTLVLFLVLGLIFGAVATAEAGKKKKKVTREVEGSYDAPPLILAGTCAQSGAIGCVSFPTGPGEKYLTASVTDTHGQPVYVSVQAQMDPASTGDDTVFGTFCGETSEAIEVPSGVELHLWVGVSPDPGIAGCVPGQATSGTVSATLSNLP